MNHNEVNILVVDDDDIDAEAISRAFLKHRIANPIVRAIDGVDALNYLRGEGVPRLRRPHIVLLDINMPRMDGIEFLRELRSDPALTDTIVFMLTTSNADRDKTRAYQDHIAGYLVKSKVGSDFSELIRLMNCYWRIIEMPPDREQLGQASAFSTCEDKRVHAGRAHSSDV